MKKIHLLSLLLMLLALQTVAQPFNWTQVSSANGARWEGMSVAVNDKMYAFTGVYTNTSNGVITYQPISEAYNPATNQWTILPQMPVLVTHEGVALVGTNVWFIAGFNDALQAVTDVQIFNTLTNTWSTGPALPVARGGGAAVLVNNKIHFFGGLMPDRRTSSSAHYALDLNNLAAGWTARAAMPDARNHFAAVELNGKIYAIGGQYNHDGPRVETALVDVYDPATNTWSDGVNLPSPISHHEPGTFVHNGKIILVSGGFEGIGNQNILQFNPATNSWSTLGQLPLALFSASAKIIGNQLIVCNGGKNTRHDTRKETYITTFGTSGNQPSCVLQVQSLSLMYSGTAGEIGLLENGDTINLHTYNSFSIRANPCSTDVKSVKFFVNGNFTRTESSLPFSIAGDNAGNYTKWNVGVGQYTVSVTPYSASGGGGTVGTPLSISFTIINQAATADCNGVPNGNAFHDDCGICSGGTSGHIANSDKDDCGICFGNNTSKDCNNVCSGTAFIDNCGFCVGGNTGLNPCSVDCNGTPGGTAFHDDCGICSNGTTGHIANSDKDDCGVCFGDNANKDCSGVCFGTAQIDNCGVCAGGTTGIVPNSSCQTEPCSLRIEQIALVQAFSTNTIQTLVNGSVINLHHTPDINIRAFTCTNIVGSVKFNLNGTNIIENGAPYVLAGDNNGVYKKWNIAPGSYTLTVTAHSARNGTGSAGNAKTISFTIINQAVTTDCNGVANGTAFIDDCGICSGGNTGHAANSDKDDCGICFGNNASKDCNGVCNGAAFIDNCGSCVGGNTGANPCAAADCNGVQNGTAFIDDCGICSGGNTGHAANSDKDDCGICFGNNASKDCNGVCNGAAFIDNCGGCVGGNTGNAPCGGNAVTSLTLVSAATHQDIRQFVNGDVIDFALTGNKLSVRANTNPALVGSVRFSYDGEVNYTIENIAPYTIKGDNNGKYNVWTPTAGNHTLTVTPFSGRAATGTAGAAITVNFTVVNSAAKMDGGSFENEKEETGFSVYPNPNNGLFTLEMNSASTEDVRIVIFNALGKEIYMLEKTALEGVSSEMIDMSNHPEGVYLLRMQSGKDVRVRKVVVNN